MGTEEPEQKNSAPSAFQIKYFGAGFGFFLVWDTVVALACMCWLQGVIA